MRKQCLYIIALGLKNQMGERPIKYKHMIENKEDKDVNVIDF